MATSIYLGNPPENIKKWIEENYVKPDMTKVPLTFTAEEAGAKLSLQSSNGPTVTLETSTTGEEGSWTPYVVGTEIVLENVGDKVMFRNSSDEIQVLTISDYECHQFKINSGKIAASGNIMFLMDKTGELKDLSGKDMCYYGMFSNCTALTQAPTLPAMTLVYSCYASMFRNCRSLNQAPALPATTLGSYCYNYMFSGCTSLTKAPELPATTLAYECYTYMFEGCSSLNQAPEFQSTNLSDSCYNNMFSQCKSPFTFSDKTFDEISYLILITNLIGDSYWRYYDEEDNEIKINPIEIVCSDKTMLATFDENYWEWTLTEK